MLKARIDDLTAREGKRLYDALCSAYRRPEHLAVMVRRGLGVPLDRIVARSSLESMTFDLVQWAQSRGKLEELIAAAHAANPNNEELTSLITGIKTGTKAELSRAQYNQLVDALIAAYPTIQKFQQMLWSKFGTSIERIVTQGTLDSIIIDVIDWFDAQSKLKELIKAAYEAALEEFIKAYSVSPLLVLYNAARDMQIALPPPPRLTNESS